MLILSLAIALVVIDQVTKAAIRANFLWGEELPIIPGFFSLRYGQNTGAAWGILSGFNDGLVIFSLLMLIAIMVFRRHFVTNSRLCHIAVGAMAGGIVGNLIDRIRLGYVVDFLDFYIKESHFPAFNVADSAICVGVGLYLLSQFFFSRAQKAVGPATKAEGGEARE